MTFYHGSPIGGLHRLEPFLSEHGRPYVYFATDPLVALLYAVKPVPKPFSYYPYGFDADGHAVYSEYFEDAFHCLYNGRTGYLYECRDLKAADAPTQINCAYTCASPVDVDRVTEIPDLYAHFMAQAEAGRFSVRARAEISDREMAFVARELRRDIEAHELRAIPQHAMSRFIQAHFPDVWDAQ